MAGRTCPDCNVVPEPVDHVSDHRGNGIHIDDPENDGFAGLVGGRTYPDCPCPECRLGRRYADCGRSVPPARTRVNGTHGPRDRRIRGILTRCIEIFLRTSG
jgi:hypothetical protein